ncbi:hypothetical protein CO230_04805 [Chryseobacterium sp. 6424]|uniref:hypothetical protein n=1 Tax=Chryseobacterium sp. 6424 TaxID=2039166 RepID=UPI000EFAAE3D|nr:hypothetical protein [Chryseobacterium sp. 6424]AYO57501.1 hypothetical protein CO230_04805 [Chryseobacterium sp. 6424]
MKNFIATVFVSGLILASCSKKETETESNTMLQEPEVSTVQQDTATKAYGDGSPLAPDSVVIEPAPQAGQAQ